MLLAMFALAAAISGCETERILEPDSPARQATRAAGKSIVPDRTLDDRILALDSERITADDVRDTLAKSPALQIMMLHGGIVGVCLVMVSTGKFLVAMGYPENRIRHAGDRRWSHSPYEDRAQIARGAAPGPRKARRRIARGLESRTASDRRNPGSLAHEWPTSSSKT